MAFVGNRWMLLDVRLLELINIIGHIAIDGGEIDIELHG